MTQFYKTNIEMQVKSREMIAINAFYHKIQKIAKA